MAGATRPVQGGAYSGPRSEPGGQNTPRAGRVVASYGTYTVALGTFAQQVDQGDIWDDAADATAIVTAGGSGVEDYTSSDSGAGTATESGTGVESYASSDGGAGTITASGTGVESQTYVYTDSRTCTVTASGSGFQTYTPYDAALDADNPVSHWKLGDASTAIDRRQTFNLPAVSGPISTASAIIANNAADPASQFVSGQWFDGGISAGRGRPYNQQSFSVEAWIRPTATSLSAGRMVLSRGSNAGLFLQGGVPWFKSDSGVGNLVAGPVSLVASTAYHLAGTVTAGGAAILYVNGVEAARKTGVTVQNDSVTAPAIGTDFDGVIDEAAWYGDALSPARVLAHYQAGFTIYGDSGSGTATASGTGAESATYTDTGSGTVTGSGTGVEGYAYADSGAGTVTASGTGAESAARSASGTCTATASGTALESASADDAGTCTATVSGSGVGGHIGTGGRTCTVTASGTGAESYTVGYSDTGSGTISSTGSGTDSHSYDYSASGAITASGTGAEDGAYADSASATTNATGSGTDSHSYDFSTTGTVATSGTGAESYSCTDSAAGTSIVLGSGTESYVVVASTALLIATVI